MPSYGRQVGETTGTIIEVTADGEPDWKPGGITIDWATVTAAGADTTLADGTVVRAGEKAIEFGTVLTTITASGKVGPYASGAADGRQTLTRGAAYILNQSVVEKGAHGLIAVASDHAAVIEGGLVWKARLKVGGTGPTLAAFETVFPRIRYAQ